MLKKLGVLLSLLFVFLLVFTGCGSSSSSEIYSQEPVLSTNTEMLPAGAQVAMLVSETDSETETNKIIWNTISRFAGEAGLSSSIYKVDGSDHDLSLSTLELSVKGGAELIVIAGPELASIADEAQRIHKEVEFIFIGIPIPEKLENNGAFVGYSAEQGGWLAGYAAVIEGKVNLGYLETDDPIAQRYALGFLMGAEAAAAEQKLQAGSIRVHPLPFEMVGEIEEWKEQIGLLYASGTDLVFANYAAVQSEVLAAARKAQGQMIGVGLALAPAGSTGLTTVWNDPQAVLYKVLTDWKTNRFPHGRIVEGTVADGGVSLIVDTETLSNLTPRRYESLVALFTSSSLPSKLADKVKVDKEGNLPLPESLTLDHLTIIRWGDTEGGSAVSGRQMPVSSKAIPAVEENAEATVPAPADTGLNTEDTNGEENGNTPHSIPPSEEIKPEGAGDEEQTTDAP